MVSYVANFGVAVKKYGRAKGGREGRIGFLVGLNKNGCSFLRRETDDVRFGG